MVKLDYDKTIELQVEYGNNAICGYITNPKIHEGRITGLCALFDGWKCKKYPPMNIEECPKYKERFG